MSQSDLVDAVQAKLPSNCFAHKAPDDQKGTYAVWYLSFHPRKERLTLQADLRFDVYSQTSAAAARDLADAIDAALNGWGGTLLDGYLAPLYAEGFQEVPADQSEPLVTRLTGAFIGLWASTDRAVSLDETEGVS